MRLYTTTNLSDHIDATPEGYLVCREAALGRTGAMRYLPEEVADVVMEGTDADIALIYRDEDAVFSPDTLASFEGKPLTLDHPEEDVDPDTWKDLAVGVVMDVRRGTGPKADLLLADILVTDAEAIKAVKNGLRELSCGAAANEQTTAGEETAADEEADTPAKEEYPTADEDGEDVNRKSEATVKSGLCVADLAYGASVILKNGKFAPVDEDAGAMYGFLIRPYPTQEGERL